jgi:hypothetical protein
MGQIACLANEDLMDVKRFGLDFEDALSLDCEWQFFGSSMQMLDAFSTGYNPQVVLVHLEHIPLVEIHRLIEGLRRSDPEACLMVLSGKDLQREEAMAWLDVGVHGVVRIPFDPLLVSDPLVEVLKKKLGYHRSAPRVPALQKISLNIASLEQAIAAETINVSCTGLFVRVAPGSVRVGELVEFCLSVVPEIGRGEGSLLNPLDRVVGASGVVSEIRGRAEVVWVRPSARGSLPEGVGLRFMDLGDSGMDALRSYIAKRRLNSMIPDGG